MTVGNYRPLSHLNRTREGDKKKKMQAEGQRMYQAWPQRVLSFFVRYLWHLSSEPMPNPGELSIHVASA